MAISGLVVTLKPDADEAARALAIMASDRRLTIGDRFGHKVALVAETEGVGADRDLWDDLRGTPGVEFVDVTFIALDAPGSEGVATVEHTEEDAHVDG